MNTNSVAYQVALARADEAVFRAIAVGMCLLFAWAGPPLGIHPPAAIGALFVAHSVMAHLAYRKAARIAR